MGAGGAAGFGAFNPVIAGTASGEDPPVRAAERGTPDMLTPSRAVLDCERVAHAMLRVVRVVLVVLAVQ